VIPLEAGQMAPRIEFVESGLVVDIHDPSYERYDDALIQLFDPQELTLVRELETRAQSAGTVFTLPNLDPGTYLLRILPRRFLTQGWIGQWYDGAQAPSEATPVIIPENGGIARVRMDLQEGGYVSGMLTFPQSLPFYDAVFYLTRADEPEPVGVLGPEGTHVIGTRSYRLSGLPAGRYRLGVLPLGSGHGAWPQQPPSNVIWYPGTTSWDEAAVLEVIPPEEISGIDFELEQAAAPGRRMNQPCDSDRGPAGSERRSASRAR
jgi:hypothetical protein